MPHPSECGTSDSGSGTGVGELELLARGDTELGEDVAQMSLDDARADEDTGPDLGVGQAVTYPPDDPRLLGGEVGRRLGTAPAGSLPGGRPFMLGPVRSLSRRKMSVAPAASPLRAPASITSSRAPRPVHAGRGLGVQSRFGDVRRHAVRAPPLVRSARPLTNGFGRPPRCAALVRDAGHEHHAHRPSADLPTPDSHRHQNPARTASVSPSSSAHASRLPRSVRPHRPNRPPQYPEHFTKRIL